MEGGSNTIDILSSKKRGEGDVFVVAVADVVVGEVREGEDERGTTFSLSVEDNVR